MLLLKQQHQNSVTSDYIKHYTRLTNKTDMVLVIHCVIVVISMFIALVCLLYF